MGHMRTLLLLISLLGVACTKPNPNICCVDEADCAAHGLDEVAPCAPGLLCRGNQCIAEACGSGVDCDASAPYCHDGRCQESCAADLDCPGFYQEANAVYCVSGTCVGCRGSEDCANPVPVCDTGACRGCASDAECTSSVCDIDAGVCVDESKVVYASPDGMETNGCGHANPCTLAAAFTQVSATGKPWLRMLPGSYPSAGTVNMNGTFTLVGSGSTLGGGLTALTNANVTVRGLTITQLVQCSSGGSTALTLRNVRVTNVVSGTGPNGVCQLVLREVEMSADVYVGYNTVAQIDRSRLQLVHLVRDPQSAGFSFRMTNCFAKGLDLSALGSAATTVYVAYNTFSSNGTMVTCDSDSTTPVGITFINNIFYGTGTLDAVANNGTRCIFDTNIEYPQTSPVGQGAIVNDPKLVDPIAANFHLGAGSPALDAAKSITNEPAEDFEGTKRPQGSRNDIGAIEQVP
jgi:hypothetical protein